MTYEVNHWERVVRAVPELNAPANMGQACFKGKFGFEYVNDKRRIRKPLVRRDGELQEASWDEAIAAAAEGLAPHRGPAFALMANPRNTNEELYAAQKFARAVMGSNGRRRRVERPPRHRRGAAGHVRLLRRNDDRVGARGLRRRHGGQCKPY